MMKPVSVLSVLVVMAGLSVPTASALSASEAKACRAMGASLQVRQTETKTLSSEREAMLEALEIAGEEWDAAEVMRDFGAQQAKDADALKASYDGLKTDLMKTEMALQSAVSMINGDVAAYNVRCLKK